jgi:enoyl-CoA hydratase/carnithine racemase
MEAKWGLVPDMGLTQSLPRLMPADRALELMLTARVVTGDEAAGLGLVTRLARDPLAEARALAERLCTVSPEVLRGAKRLVAAAWWRDPAALRLEAEVQAALMGGANQIEAVSAAMQRRPARFGGAAASAPVAPARGAVPD